MSLELRIGSGKYRGRIIPVPARSGRQPRAFTPSVVKEAIFQILANRDAGPDAGFAFFDLCAGSGQVLLEALSRGYPVLHACEPDRLRFAALAKTLRAYDDKVTLHARDLRRSAQMLLEYPHTIAFLDPPYSFWEGPVCEPVSELLLQISTRLRLSKARRLLLLIQGPRALELPEQLGEAGAPASFETRTYRSTTLSILEWPGD